jgi:hypothetical protein
MNKHILSITDEKLIQILIESCREEIPEMYKAGFDTAEIKSVEYNAKRGITDIVLASNLFRPSSEGGEPNGTYFSPNTQKRIES